MFGKVIYNVNAFNVEEVSGTTGKNNFFTIPSGHYTSSDLLQILNEKLLYCTFVETEKVDNYRSNFIFDLNENGDDRASVRIVSNAEFFFLFGFHGIGTTLANLNNEMEFTLKKMNEGTQFHIDCISHMLNCSVYMQSLGLHNTTGSQVGSICFTETEMSELLQNKRSVTFCYPKESNPKNLHCPANSCRFFMQNQLMSNILCDYLCIETDITYPDE